MVNYLCPRCGFKTNIKTKYLNHLRRKYICKNKLSDNNLNFEYIKYNIQEKLVSNKNPTKIQHYPNNFQQKSNKNPALISEKQYKCNFCLKKFKHNQSYYRHLKSCKEKIKDEECKENMTELVKLLNDQLLQYKKELEKRDLELEKRNRQIDELIKKTDINIGTQNNIQNNIKILAYKNTDLSHLTDQDYIQCLNRSNMVIPNLIKKIHFNPKKPENHNIYISNIKNKYIMIYDGKKWNLNNQNDTIEDLIDTNEIVIEQKLEEWIENGKDYPEIMKKFNRYLEKKEKDSVINKIKEEIKLILFNNRKIIKEIEF